MIASMNTSLAEIPMPNERVVVSKPKHVKLATASQKVRERHENQLKRRIQRLSLDGNDEDCHKDDEE